MQKEITEKQQWHKIDGSNGIDYSPADIFSLEEAKDDYIGEVWEAKTIWGYGARMTASGYLDCTDWAVFDTEKEAVNYLDETYD